MGQSRLGRDSPYERWQGSRGRSRTAPIKEFRPATAGAGLKKPVRVVARRGKKGVRSLFLMFNLPSAGKEGKRLLTPFLFVARPD